mgnify:CR=1 FL=1
MTDQNGISSMYSNQTKMNAEMVKSIQSLVLGVCLPAIVVLTLLGIVSYIYHFNLRLIQWALVVRLIVYNWSWDTNKKCSLNLESFYFSSRSRGKWTHGNVWKPIQSADRDIIAWILRARSKSQCIQVSCTCSWIAFHALTFHPWARVIEWDDSGKHDFRAKQKRPNKAK